MDKPERGQVSKGFVTKDRKFTLFLLRMKEEGRQKNRLQIIEELKQMARAKQFSPHLEGGIYALQGHLSSHVASSLVFGLGRLILIFAVIALIVSLSLRSGLAMTFSVCLIPLCILGPIGFFGIPLDIIAAPAANIAIAIGIDAMIHMVHAYRRLAKETKDKTKIWLMVQEKLWEPIMASMLIVSAGFGIFFFSSFPPTQRFGGSIVFGTVIAAFTALFIFPLLAKKEPRLKSKQELKTKTRRFEHLEIPQKDTDRGDFSLN